MNKYFDLYPTPFKGMSMVIGGRPLTEAETTSGEFVGDDVGGGLQLAMRLSESQPPLNKPCFFKA